ncbi:hypothetical protein A0J61_05138 [Choanephora cucurbitarum]|uniref:Transcription factor IIIC 90kDa subunit N-terminal domain-containing protein n=1 Tax=Choanephora cucurbitarum TaxID=101091 RepID=A0A1C7NCG5_9FUNG|nr:hypothetical protein A0J61_05138 [Choanephora cucurbitarum]
MENQPGITFKGRPYFADCVKWNEDSQLTICLSNHVHIVTPILSGMASKKEGYIHVGFSLPPLENTGDQVLIEDPDKIQTSFFNNEGFRCANWSPTGLSASKSCFLVVVTTKHRVLIYQSSPKDPSNSDWQLVRDLTHEIEAHQVDVDYPTKINPHHTLYAIWSKALVPDPLAFKPSLLATTNKAGHVNIWTSAMDNAFKYADTITAHRSFVNLVEWSGWKNIDNCKYVAYVVSSSVDGTVVLSSVQVTLELKDSNPTIENVQTDILYTWFDNEPGHVNFIKISDEFNADGSSMKLALCKGVTLRFLDFSWTSNQLNVERDWRELELVHSTLGLAGGSWISPHVFQAFTAEGEGMQIDCSSADSLEVDIKANALINTKLVQKYKQHWVEEQMKMEDHIIGASDATPSLEGVCDAPGHIFTAIVFRMRPDVDIRYGPESGEDTTLAFILQKERNLDIEPLCQDVDRYVNDPNFFFVQPVKGLIRELLQYLVDDDTSKPLCIWLEKLSEYIQRSSEHSKESCQNLTRAIYSQPHVIASRIVINADIELANYSPQVFEDELKAVVGKSKDVIQNNYFSNILDFALKIPDEEFANLKDQDILVLLLLSDTAVVSKDRSLVKRTLEIYTRLQDKFPKLDLYNEIAFASSSEDQNMVFEPKAREKCLVCDEHVQTINNSTLAQCSAGHFWELCSMTKRILHSPNSRKCVTCGLKSLRSNGEEEAFLTRVILDSCLHCIYCGSGLLIT